MSGRTSEQVALGATIRRFALERWSLADVRARVVDVPEDKAASAWPELVEEIGLQLIGVPEEFGGTGDSWTDQVVVAEELGRGLVPAPFLPSAVIVASVVAQLAPDSEPAAAWLAELVSGGVVASPLLGSGCRPTAVATATRTDDGRWTVSGAPRAVLHGSEADDLLVLATTDLGAGLFRVAVSAEGVEIDAAAVVDSTRPLADVRLDGAPAVELRTGVDVETALHAAIARARIVLAAEQIGAATAALELTVAHARTRVQFGRPIGGFQSIKHQLARALLEIESVRAAVDAAGALHDAGIPGPSEWSELVELGHVCQAAASEALLEAAKVAVQVHGAVGFTWEHDASLYFKRAFTSVPLLGSPGEHREALAAGLLD